MGFIRSVGARIITAAVILAGVPFANAQSNSGLPGGATSVRETHGDWTVICSVTPQSRKSCIMQQELRSQQSGQRILALELRPAGPGADSTLVLPFGLALAKGATIQIDDNAPSVPISFRTCLPQGCLAPVNMDAKMLAVMRKATALKIAATPDGGGTAMQWLVSPKGFGAALDRVVTLQN